MKFSIERDALLKPLQQVIGAVERRQTMPMLNNVLLRSQGSCLTLTASDLEVELIAQIDMMPVPEGEATLPARKLLDICRALPEEAELVLDIQNGKASIRAARSRFLLVTLPAGDFPVVDDIQHTWSTSLPEGALKDLIDCTAFAMAQQDVRYYLNGLLLHVNGASLRTVATDGHRLATCQLDANDANAGLHQVIIPRKGAQELQRLLTDGDEEARLELSGNHIRVRVKNLCFTSKLIDGRFPDYERVLPKECDKVLEVDRESLKRALIRAAILSSDKHRGVRLTLDGPSLKIQAHNPEQEEAEEELEVQYAGDPIEIGFNVNYLLDVLNIVESETIELRLKDANSSALMKAPASEQALYVIMPMRL